MKSDFIVKLILVTIAVFLGIIALRPAAAPEIALAMPLPPQNIKISEFQKFDVVFTPAFSAQGEIDTRVSNGWKPISITSYKNDKNDGLFILFGK